MRIKGETSILAQKDSMRSEYDLSNGERGKFYGKVDTKNPVLIVDEETPCEISEDDSSFKIND